MGTSDIQSADIFEEVNFNRAIALENLPVTPLLPTLRPIAATVLSF